MIRFHRVGYLENNILFCMLILIKLFWYAEEEKHWLVGQKRFEVGKLWSMSCISYIILKHLLHMCTVSWDVSCIQTKLRIFYGNCKLRCRMWFSRLTQMKKNSLSFIQAIFKHGSSYCLVSLLYIKNYLPLQRLKRTGEDYAHFPLDIKLVILVTLVQCWSPWMHTGEGTYNACAVKRTMLAET